MWICSICNLHNVAFNTKCADYKCHAPRVEHYETDEVTEWIHQNRFNLMSVTVAESNEDMYARFFSAEVRRVQDMSDNELVLWQDELAAIAREAKAKWNAVEHVKRGRAAKNKVWNVTNDEANPNQTERLAKVVKERKSKADITKETMLKLGMSAEHVNELMKNFVLDGKTASRDVRNSDITFRKHQDAIADAAIQQAEQEAEQRSQNAVTEQQTVTSNEVNITEVKPTFNNPFKK